MRCFKSTGTLQTPLFPVLAQGHVLVTGSISCVRLACALLSQHKKRGPSWAQTVHIPFLTPAMLIPLSLQEAAELFQSAVFLAPICLCRPKETLSF